MPDYTQQYVPPSGNPVQASVEEWDRLRAEYMSATDQLRIAEGEIHVKDRMIEELSAKIRVLQHERDEAVTVAAEVRVGLTTAGTVVVDLIKRYDKAAEAFRTSQATTIATPVPETPRKQPVGPSRYMPEYTDHWHQSSEGPATPHRTPLPDGPGFVSDRPHYRTEEVPALPPSV